ncbi:MAG: hypothetical protein WBK95_06520 [Sulfurimonas sp.]|nr:hypothetical protein [Sulfurimonas sp.]MDD3060902.1 hypothetical protein [Sulfurimonas sp.]MDD5201847.1 hypothetical protein [Sulfurimonas sp.]
MTQQNSTLLTDGKMFFDNIVPKFLNKFVAKSKKDFWQRYFDSMNPKKFLGYDSEKSYLEIHNFTKKQIVLNSIHDIYSDLDTKG